MAGKMNPWYMSGMADVLVFLVHNHDHQALLIIRSGEWIPVLYDGLGNNPSAPIMDCAQALCTGLGEALTGNASYLAG